MAFLLLNCTDPASHPRAPRGRPGRGLAPRGGAARLGPRLTSCGCRAACGGGCPGTGLRFYQKIYKNTSRWGQIYSFRLSPCFLCRPQERAAEPGGAGWQRRGRDEAGWLPGCGVKLWRGLIRFCSCSVSLKDFAHIKMMEHRPARWLCRLISLSDLLLLWKSQPCWAGWGFVLLVSSGQVPHLWCWYFAGLQGSRLAYKPQTSAGVMVGLLADFSRGGDLLYGVDQFWKSKLDAMWRSLGEQGKLSASPK